MLRNGLEFTGEVEEYMREIGWDRYRGWVAVYAKEKGKITVHRSGLGDFVRLPMDNLQGYLVLFRRYSKNRVLWVDGYDEYALIGREERVKGKQLSDKRYAAVQEVMMQEFEKWVHGGD